MASQLSYAPIIELSDESAYAAENLAKKLRDKELHACLVKRGSGSSLEKARVISRELLSRGILPIVEIFPGDESMPLRNLVETCLLGMLEIIWSNGEPGFDANALLDILDSTGRHRLPLDVVLRFEGQLPDQKAYKSLVRKIGELADKYGHIQVVKLSEIPPDDGDGRIIEEATNNLKSLLDVCPRVKAAVSPSVWVNNSSVRSIASDLGLISIDLESSSYEEFNSGELTGVEHLSSQVGLPLVARLPLVPRFYRKGWYAFEVGKAFDAWVDRRAFRAYKDRPRWLED